MREILFRGKTEQFGNWIEGSLIVGRNLESGHLEYLIAPLSAYYTEVKKVIPETIGQYTGLIDKNGKKIFEGDICQTKGYALIDEKPFEVVWNDYYSGWYWQDIEVSRETDALTKTVAELTKVIGNIHDNTELLGDE